MLNVASQPTSRLRGTVMNVVWASAPLDSCDDTKKRGSAISEVSNLCILEQCEHCEVTRTRYLEFAGSGLTVDVCGGNHIHYRLIDLTITFCEYRKHFCGVTTCAHSSQ